MKQKTILESEAAMLDTENRARGEAAAILARAEATARSVELLSAALIAPGGAAAAQLRVAENYLTAFGNIAKAGTTMLLPANASEPAAMVAQALGIYKATVDAPGAGAPGGGSVVKREHRSAENDAAAAPASTASPRAAATAVEETLRSFALPVRSTLSEEQSDNASRPRFSLQR